MTHPQNIRELNQNMTPMTVGRKTITVPGYDMPHLLSGTEVRFRVGVVVPKQPKDKSWDIFKATHLRKALGKPCSQDNKKRGAERHNTNG